MAIAGLVMGLVGGGAAGMILGTPVFVSAENGAPEQSSTTVPADPGGSRVAPDRTERMRDRLDRALEGLVADGTIDRDQADAVVDALTDAYREFRSGLADRMKHGWERGADPRGHGERPAGIFRGMKEIYDAIGLEPGEILEELRNGRTIAQIAEEHGVERQALIDAVIDPLTERLDAAVADGRTTRARADEMIARTTEGVERAIDTDLGSAWKDFGRRHHGGHDRAPGTDAEPGD